MTLRVRAVRAIGATSMVILAACGGTQSVPARSNDQASNAPAVSASGSTVTDAPGADKGATAARSRVLFIGTSLTAGFGLDPSEAFPALLQAKADSLGLAVEMVNAGVSGETSAGAVRRIDWLLRSPADVIVIETGANDGLRALDVDSTRANIDAIVARAKAVRPGAQILLVQMEAPRNLGIRYTASFHAMFPDIAKRYGATLVPFLLDRVAGIRALNQEDGMHPNLKGEQIVAENVWRTLKPVVEGK
ncbi:MAG: arylesterase [Vicinamibacterales bacterium]